jgi:hypothetical protein
MNSALANEGFPTFDQTSNESVRAHYYQKSGTECSPEAHELDILTCERIREQFRAEFASVQREMPLIGIYSWQFAGGSSQVERTYRCGRCAKELHKKFLRTRMVAILNEPVKNAWIGVVKPDLTSPSNNSLKLFEGSYICHYRKDRYIVTEHVVLESKDTNKWRMQHHRGDRFCMHEKPYLRPRVKFLDGSTSTTILPTPAPTAEQLVAIYAASLGQ